MRLARPAWARACALTLLVLPALAACSNMREQLGLTKTPPDEFAVVKRAPLSLPPNFGLRPPTSGDRRPQEPPIPTQARDTLLRQTEVASTDPKAIDLEAQSPGEAAFLGRLGTGKPETGFRRQLDQETAALNVDDRSFVEKLMWWRKRNAENELVDAQKESQRLRENAALGKAPTEGDTPVIERKQRAVRLF